MGREAGEKRSINTAHSPNACVSHVSHVQVVTMSIVPWIPRIKYFPIFAFLLDFQTTHTRGMFALNWEIISEKIDSTRQMANIDLMSRHYVTCHVSRLRHDYLSSSVITDVLPQISTSKNYKKETLFLKVWSVVWCWWLEEVPITHNRAVNGNVQRFFNPTFYWKDPIKLWLETDFYCVGCVVSFEISCSIICSGWQMSCKREGVLCW